MSPAFAGFIAPAERRPAIWRLLLGLVVMGVVTLLWFALVFGGLYLRLGMERLQEILQSMMQPATPTTTIILLSTFIGMALAPMAAAALHRRGPGTLFGPRARLVRHFAAAAGLVAVVYAVSLTFSAATAPPLRNLSPDLWLRLLPAALVLILIQTGAEEMIFRGYLLQQMAARFRWRLAWLVIPALVFGALHYDPTTAGSNALLVAGSATVFGFVAADLTARTGSLGAAWGLHFANNVAALLVVATQGTITGLALYVTPYSVSDVELSPLLVALDTGVLLAIWAVLRWRLRP